MLLGGLAVSHPDRLGQPHNKLTMIRAWNRELHVVEIGRFARLFGVCLVRGESGTLADSGAGCAFYLGGERTARMHGTGFRERRRDNWTCSLLRNCWGHDLFGPAP